MYYVLVECTSRCYYVVLAPGQSLLWCTCEYLGTLLMYYVLDGMY